MLFTNIVPNLENGPRILALSETDPVQNNVLHNWPLHMSSVQKPVMFGSTDMVAKVRVGLIVGNS